MKWNKNRCDCSCLFYVVRPSSALESFTAFRMLKGTRWKASLCYLKNVNITESSRAPQITLEVISVLCQQLYDDPWITHRGNPPTTPSTQNVPLYHCIICDFIFHYSKNKVNNSNALTFSETLDVMNARDLETEQNALYCVFTICHLKIWGINFVPNS